MAVGGCGYPKCNSPTHFEQLNYLRCAETALKHPSLKHPALKRPALKHHRNIAVPKVCRKLYKHSKSKPSYPPTHIPPKNPIPIAPKITLPPKKSPYFINTQGSNSSRQLAPAHSFFARPFARSAKRRAA